MSPLTPMTTPVTMRSAGPIASTASANGQRLRGRDGDVHGAAQHRRQRGAGRARADVGQLAQRVELEVVELGGAHGKVLSRRSGEGGGGDARRALAERVAVDDEGDLAVGQHGAAGQGGVLGHLGRQRAGDELVLADELGDGERRGASRRCGRSRRGRPRASPTRHRRAAAVDDRQHAVAHDEHPRAGDGAHACGRRAGRCARCGRSAPRTGAPSTSTSIAAMIASVSGSRTCAVVPWPSSECSSTSPPSSRTVVRTASMPTPRPEMSRRDLGGREAGVEEQLGGGLGVDRVDRVGRDQPALGGLAGDLGGIDAAAVVAHGDDHVAAGVAGGDLQRAGRRLAGGDALVRPARGRGRASCGRGGRAGRRARRPRCGRARSPCRRA